MSLKLVNWGFLSYTPELSKPGDKLIKSIVLPAPRPVQHQPVQINRPRGTAAQEPFHLVYSITLAPPKGLVELWQRPSNSRFGDRQTDYEVRVNGAWMVRAYNEYSIGPSLDDWARHARLQFVGFPPGANGRAHYLHVPSGVLYYGALQKLGTAGGALYFVRSTLTLPPNLTCQTKP